MTIVPRLNEAIAQLGEGLSADEIARVWRHGPDDVKPREGTLLVVRSPLPPWRLVQVATSSNGDLEVFFDLPDEQPAFVAELVAAYGEPDVEQASDGPSLLWFTPDKARRFLIAAAVRQSEGPEMTRSVRVVRLASRR
jgi:hypothetical protein